MFPAVPAVVVVLPVPILAPLGAIVVVVVVLPVLVVAVAFTADAAVVVVAFCDKQADCMLAAVVAFPPPVSDPNDAPLGAVVAVVTLPPVACTGDNWPDTTEM
jgi:hypothetical protein